MKKEELGKEGVTEEFTVLELLQQAKEDASWEADPQKRKDYADSFLFYIKSFL